MASENFSLEWASAECTQAIVQLREHTYAAPAKSLAANSLLPSAFRASAMLAVVKVVKGY